MALRCVASVARGCRVQPLPLSSVRAGLPAIQVALITGKTMRGAPKPWKREAWPYKEKPYRGLKSFFDRTTSRWDENSKIVVVDGPPATGKDVVAKALAEEFEMQYMPPCSGDLMYTNEYGYDQRSLNPQLPWKTQLMDIPDFLANPRDERMAAFQLVRFRFKLSQYVDALAHMFNTGQGVVMNRSVFSDVVYMNAMFSAGYVHRRVKTKYHEIAASALGDPTLTLRPHLIVYLDLPAEEVKKRVAARKLPHEVNSPTLTDNFLDSVDSEYRSFIQEIGGHSEILSYDMRENVPVEHMVDDIEHINFDDYHDLSPEGVNEANMKMRDWRKYQHGSTEDEWDNIRFMVTNCKDQILDGSVLPMFEVPELQVSMEDAKTFYELFHENESMGQRFQRGFNTSMGDSVLFKLNEAASHRDTTRY